MKKKLTLVVSLLLVMALSIGGTLAYLTDKTEAITNTFTVGNVKIALAETNVDEGSELANSYKMIPGNTIAKDPTITVDSGSETCWVFVKVEGNSSYSSYLEHVMADGWTPVSGAANVFVYSDGTDNEIAAGTEIAVLKDNQVTVKTTVTQDMMDDITNPEKNVDEPTLTITAYAVQYANVKTVAEAWAAVNS